MALSCWAAHARAAWYGDACLDVEIIRLLQGELVANIARECVDAAGVTLADSEAEDGTCPPACRRAVERFVSARCFADISRPQRGPRSSLSPLHALSGTWLAMLPSSGLELVHVALEEPRIGRADDDNARGTAGRPNERKLVATKLTGNERMKAGRRSWEVGEQADWCRIQSSEYAGAFLPRWDSCELIVHDRDHITIRLAHETVEYVRAERRLILSWPARKASTYGVGAALRSCGLDSERGAWLDALDVGRRAVLTDQLLLCAPFALLAAWHGAARRRWPEHQRRLLVQVGVPVYCFLLARRLRATGVWAEVAWAWRALFGGLRPRLDG